MAEVSIGHWYEALASDFGIVIKCSGDPELTRQKLYRLRKEAKDSALESISVLSSPEKPGDLWLVKRKSNAAT